MTGLQSLRWCYRIQRPAFGPQVINYHVNRASKRDLKPNRLDGPATLVFFFLARALQMWERSIRCVTQLHAHMFRRLCALAPSILDAYLPDDRCWCCGELVALLWLGNALKMKSHPPGLHINNWYILYVMSVRCFLKIKLLLLTCWLSLIDSAKSHFLSIPDWRILIASPQQHYVQCKSSNPRSCLTDTNIIRKNYSHPGMQRHGMTRSSDPYPFYPPDSSGRRPSEHTQLQYTSPEHRAASQQQSYSRDRPHGSHNDDRNVTSPQSNDGRHHLPQHQQPTLYWYCCQQGCPNSGPYLASLYSDCVLGCATRRCSACPQRSFLREPPRESHSQG